MADAYVNFYGQREFRNAAQTYLGRSSQAARDTAAVGADAANATAIDLSEDTQYVEIGATSGDVFFCILPTGSNSTTRTARRLRLTEGSEKSFIRPLSEASTLYIWAA